MKFTAIIPARYASQRLPGKPLVDIAGLTMIERVYRQASQSSATDVIVATDHQAIYDEVKTFGGKVCMTREDHASGTDRLAEVVDFLGLADDDIVVNVQGDEPLIPAAVINQVAANLHNNATASVATISEKIPSVSTYLDPNSVKVVADQAGMALYFSRAPIPWNRDLIDSFGEHSQDLDTFVSTNTAVQKHIGIYAYRVSLLHEFVTWPSGQLEKIERLEQLRAMENGKKIHVEEACEAVPGGIDTEENLEEVRRWFSENE